jgi:predicted GH43/DUF377 family glycosyl hydrolase
VACGAVLDRPGDRGQVALDVGPTDVPNVVFPCAALVDESADRLSVYYDGADTVVCLAHGHLSEVLEFVRA